MAHIPEGTLDEAKEKFLTRFVTLQLKDITDLALNGNMDAVSLLVFYVERAMGGAQADEQGVIEYWRALRVVEDAIALAGFPE